MPTEEGDLFSLTQVLGRAVRSPQGEVLARARDLIAHIGTDAYPPITGLVARTGSRDYFVPWGQVERIGSGGLELSSARVDLRPFVRRDGEMLLARDLLDHKVIDVTRKRVVRVNDVILSRTGESVRLAGVDAGLRAVLHRLGLGVLERPCGRYCAPVPLDWARVEFFASEAPVRLEASHAGTADMHPADIAEMVDSVSLKQGQEILGSLDDETAADALEEMSPERQADLVEGLPNERAADILEKMDPDDAADLLADLPQERAGHILEHMEPDESEDVRELLQYPERSAGGIMTTDLVAVPRSFTAGEVLEHLRSREELPEMIYYIYVVASRDSEQLVGIVPLRRVVSSPPERPLGELMCTDFLSVPVTESDREVARIMARYDLLALPVVDEEGRLLGIVTVDDAMDIILPGEWKKRVPRVFH